MEEEEKEKKEKEGVGGPAHQPAHIVLPLATLGCLSPPPFSCCYLRLSRRCLRFAIAASDSPPPTTIWTLPPTIQPPPPWIWPPPLSIRRRLFPFPSALCPLADSYLGDGDALDLSGAWTPRRRLDGAFKTRVSGNSQIVTTLGKGSYRIAVECCQPFGQSLPSRGDCYEEQSAGDKVMEHGGECRLVIICLFYSLDHTLYM
jgi:hypothetical protein